MLKAAGALMILFSSAGIGLSYSMDLKKRASQLRILKQMLYMLRGEIKYTKTPLPEAFEHISERIEEPFGTFMRVMAEKVRDMDGITFEELWREQIGICLQGTHLKQADREQLCTLGEVLGYLDIEMQLSSIELYLEQLEESLREAREAIETKQKLYRSLGLAGGVFLVILLL